MTARKKPAKKSTTKKTASKQQALHAPTCPGVYRLKNGSVAFIEANDDTEEAVIWPWKGRIADDGDFQFDYTHRTDDVWTQRGSYLEDRRLVSNYDIVEFIGGFPLPAPQKPAVTTEERKVPKLDLPITPGVYRTRGRKLVHILNNDVSCDIRTGYEFKGRIEGEDYDAEFGWDYWTKEGYFYVSQTPAEEDLIERVGDSPASTPPRPNTKPTSTSSETLTGNMQVGGDHYKNMKHQPIDVMESCMIPEELQGFLRGNALKYLMRMGSKGAALQDAQKAMHYIEMLVRSLQKQRETT